MLTHEEVLGLSYIGESYHVRVEDFFVLATDKSRQQLTDQIESGHFVRVTEDADAR